MPEDDPFRFRGPRRVVVPRQPDLFLRGIHVPANNVRMGYFYELLTSALHGGMVTNHLYYMDSGDERALTKPDVVDPGGGRVWESKANRVGYQLLLLDQQMQRYRYVQARRPHPEIFFAVYRHRLAAIKSYAGTERDLWEELAWRTARLVMLPFSVVNRLYAAGNEPAHAGLVRKYESPSGADTGYNCTRVWSPTTNGFLDNPHVALAGIGLDPDAYRWRVDETPIAWVDGVRTGPIPYVWIRDVDHAGWTERFLKDFHKDVPF